MTWNVTYLPHLNFCPLLMNTCNTLPRALSLGSRVCLCRSGATAFMTEENSYPLRIDGIVPALNDGANFFWFFNGAAQPPPPSLLDCVWSRSCV